MTDVEEYFKNYSGSESGSFKPEPPQKPGKKPVKKTWLLFFTVLLIFSVCLSGLAFEADMLSVLYVSLGVAFFSPLYTWAIERFMQTRDGRLVATTVFFLLSNLIIACIVFSPAVNLLNLGVFTGGVLLVNLVTILLADHIKDPVWRLYVIGLIATAIVVAVLWVVFSPTLLASIGIVMVEGVKTGLGASAPIPFQMGWFALIPLVIGVASCAYALRTHEKMQRSIMGPDGELVDPEYLTEEGTLLYFKGDKGSVNKQENEPGDKAKLDEYFQNRRGVLKEEKVSDAFAKEVSERFATFEEALLKQICLEEASHCTKAGIGFMGREPVNGSAVMAKEAFSKYIRDVGFYDAMVKLKASILDGNTVDRLKPKKFESILKAQNLNNIVIENILASGVVGRDREAAQEYFVKAILSIDPRMMTGSQEADLKASGEKSPDLYMALSKIIFAEKPYEVYLELKGQKQQPELKAPGASSFFAASSASSSGKEPTPSPTSNPTGGEVLPESADSVSSNKLDVQGSL